MSIKNKTVVITGAGGVLCSAFAKALAADGAKVVLLDINEQAVESVAKEIREAGGIACAYKTDVLSKENLQEVHKKILNDFGKCRILINGAGGNSPKCTTAHETYEKGDEADDDISTFFNLDKSGFSFVFDLNILGTLLPTQIFTADMLDGEDCCVLNISSMNAFRPLTKIPAYSAAKAAISNFTQWLAVHFAGKNIRVNAIAPGFFVTNQNRTLLFNEDGSKTSRSQKILNATPMGRFGEPEELFGTLRWLINAETAGFVTGIVVPVDGGFSAYSGV